PRPVRGSRNPSSVPLSYPANTEVYALRLVLALAIGGLMGLARQLHGRMGAREHTLSLPPEPPPSS
ncbi:MAG: hypothetical protein ABUS51_10280, partial [Acidobacteriota bacterium]